LHNGGGSTEDPLLNFFTERYGAAYANELNTFIAAIDSGKKDPRPNGFDGLMAQVLADAATESSKTGTPIKV
jgi:myo-inositol 2-dehydrogenase/D-chiro-inositol 1-dehydrogenase